MPKVETYGQTRVATKPLPSARQTNVPGPDAFGAQLGDVAARIGTSALVQRWDEQRQRADQLAVLEADNTLQSWRDTALNDPTKGVLNTVHGKDAVGLPDTVLPKFDEQVGYLTQSLSNDRQRDSFRQLALRSRQQVNETLMAHGSREIAAFDQQETEKGIDNAASSAIAAAGDTSAAPEVRATNIGEALAKGIAIVKDHARASGWGDEATDAAVRSVATKVHRGVISQMLAQDQDQAAQIYYEETKHQIDGEAQPEIERALETGTLRAQGQKFIDAIPPDMGEKDALAKVREITDPKLRDATQQRVVQEYAFRKQAERDDLEDTTTTLANVIDKNPQQGVHAIDPTTWAGLPISVRTNLEMYAKRNLAGDVEPDLTRWYELRKMAVENPEKFAKLPLAAELGKVGKVEYKNLVDIQTKIISGEENPKLEDFRTANEVVTQQLRFYGIDPESADTSEKGPQREAVARVTSMVAARVQALQRKTGKKASNADVQSIVDDLLTSQATAKNPSAWYQYLGFGAPTVPKRAVDLTIDDIPADKRTLTEQKLRAVGRTPSEEAIIEAYITAIQKMSRGK